MKTIKKNWQLICFIVAAICDIQTGFLESLELSNKTIIIIRFVGAIILAYNTNKKFKENETNI